jgi:hypothetical protein
MESKMENLSSVRELEDLIKLVTKRCKGKGVAGSTAEMLGVARPSIQYWIREERPIPLYIKKSIQAHLKLNNLQGN